MKKLVPILIFVLFLNNAHSQDILDTLTKEVCSCADAKKEKLAEANSQKRHMGLGICIASSIIVSSISSHKEEVTAKYGNVMDNNEEWEKLGSDIRLKMAVICPDVLMALAETGQFDTDSEPDEDEYSTIEGRIVEIKQEQFLTVAVKDNSGRSHTMLMLMFFEGSNLLTEDKLKKNDKVLVEYFEQEFYDVKAKDFRYYKIIQGINKL